MSKAQKNIDIIHSCEKHFSHWLRSQLEQKGVDTGGHHTMTGLLNLYTGKYRSQAPRLMPLFNWNKKKSKCLRLNDLHKDSSMFEETDLRFFEETAFEGQVLLLTFR